MAKNKIIGLIVLILFVIIGIVIWKSPKETNNGIKKVDEDKIAIMVFDKNQNKYVKSDTYPVGSYKLNTKDSYCANGTPIGTYDSKTGTVTTSLNKSDKCYYYFDIGKLTPTLTFSNNSIYTSNTSYYDNGFTYDGDGVLTCAINDTSSWAWDYCEVDNENKKIKFRGDCYLSINIIVTATETDTYESISSSFIVEGGTCLYPDTLVYYYDKKKKKKLKKKIKDIEEGDEVYTYNPKTGMTELKKVKKVTTCKVKEAVVLTIRGEELIIAKGHPVYVDGIGLLDVALVKENYKLIGSDGIVYTVDKVEIRNFTKEQTMYNLLLEDGSNMIIGKLGIICMSLIMISLTGIKDVSAASCC